MTARRALIPLLVAGLAAATTSAQDPTPSDGAPAGAARREVLAGDTPVAVLEGLRTTPVEPLEIDATGFEYSPPEVWGTDPETGAQYRLGEVLVQFHEEVSSAERLQALAAVPSRDRRAIAPGNWERVEVDGDAREAASVLRGHPAIRSAVLNYRAVPLQHRPNDEYYDLQWNFEALDLPLAWEINPGATSDVIVAVVDTGLNFESRTLIFNSPLGRIPIRFGAVPDLIEAGRVVHPYDFVYDDALPVDLGGHGTHVAGTIGQLTNNTVGLAGVAYEVRLMPVKVISGGSFVSWDDIFFPGNRGGSAEVVSAGIRYAADNGAKVINLSLGGTGPSPLEREAIQYAVDRGAFVAIAAGNEGADGNPVTYPAAYAGDIDGAMAVGAVNRDLRRARYSGFRDYVEICAPGGEKRHEFDYSGGITQIGYQERWSRQFMSGLEKLLALLFGFRPRFDQFEALPLEGTSMATPHIAGVAALLYSQGIRDPRAIEEAIKRFARPSDATAEECGAGLVDPRRTLRGLGLAK